MKLTFEPAASSQYTYAKLARHLGYKLNEAHARPAGSLAAIVHGSALLVCLAAITRHHRLEASTAETLSHRSGGSSSG